MLPITPEKAAAHRAKLSDLQVLWAIQVILSGAPPWKRSAAILILDLISVDWRETVGEEILGFVVDRDDPSVRRWRASVLSRDEYQCRNCGKADDLQAHHIIRWVDDPAQRLNVDNGITLCRPCHMEEHRHYG
ncbi:MULTISPECIES: HNH endonuclease [unclassified Sphingomonas]